MDTPRLQDVFFDATDTLLRVRGSVGAVYAPIAARHGLDVAPEAIDAAFGPAMAAAPPPCFPGVRAPDLLHRERGWWRDIVERTFAPLGRLSRFDAFFDEVFEVFRTPLAWEVLPGARTALRALRAQGRRLAVVSEMDARLRDALDALGLGDLFAAVVLSTRSGACKHDGGLFRVALAATSAAPERTVHIGDSVRLDVEGARRAGLVPVHFDAQGRGGTPPGVLCARSFAAIPPLLARLDAL